MVLLRGPLMPFRAGGALDGDPEAELLVELWSLGLLSAQLVQQIAQAANTVVPRPPIAVLASLGSEGRNRGNIHRDLVRKLTLETNYVAEPIEIELPLWETRARPAPTKIMSPYPILLPHELFAMMHSKAPGEFQEFVVGRGSLLDFWQGIPAGDPRLVGHPVGRRSDDEKALTIPVRLHGDGVPIGKGKNGAWR